MHGDWVQLWESFFLKHMCILSIPQMPKIRQNNLITCNKNLVKLHQNPWPALEGVQWVHVPTEF